MSIQVQSNVSQYIIDLRAAIALEIKKSAELIYNTSQATCPVDTGELKASGSIIMTGTAASVTYTAPHFGIVEFRTGFFRNACIYNESAIMKNIESAINAVNSRYGRR